MHAVAECRLLLCTTVDETLQRTLTTERKADSHTRDICTMKHNMQGIILHLTAKIPFTRFINNAIIMVTKLMQIKITNELMLVITYKQYFFLFLLNQPTFPK